MGICRCTQRACERQGPEKRAATVGSRLSTRRVPELQDLHNHDDHRINRLQLGKTCIHCRTKHQPRSTFVASSPWTAADEPWRPPDSMANLGPTGSGQPPAMPLVSWVPLVPPPAPIVLHVLDVKVRLVLGLLLLLLLLEHHGDVISSRRPWARVRRQFRPRVRRYCRTFFVWGKVRKNPSPRTSRNTADELEEPETERPPGTGMSTFCSAVAPSNAVELRSWEKP